MDIGLFIDEQDLTMDLAIENHDLATDTGLRTAVIISLFTDRRVDREDLPVGATSLGGWFGDAFPEVEGDQVGSRLWLLQREKRSVETLRRAEEYSEEALQWMIEDGVADSVTATASWDSKGFLVLEIEVQKPDDALNFRYNVQWNAEGERG